MASSRCPICNAPHRLLTGSPVQVLKRTARVLAGIVSRTRRQLRVRRPKPGEWSPVEIIAHLADVEVAAAFRIRKILAEPRPVITAFDQDAWAATFWYRRQDPKKVLETFRAIRESNLRLFGMATRAQRRRVGIHTEYGPIRLDQLVAHLAEHDLNHVNQIRQNLQQLAHRW